MEEQFAVLRELLTEAPSEEVWGQIKECLHRWPPDTVGTVAIDYLRSHMESEGWPSEYLEALGRWAPVRWDAKMKRRVHARRGGPHNPKSLKRPKAMDVETYRQHWREQALHSMGWMRNYYSDALSDGGLGLIERMEPLWQEDADGEEPLDVELEAMAYAMLLQDNNKLFGKKNIVSHWFQVGGAVFALGVLLRSRRPPMMYRFANHINVNLDVVSQEQEPEAFVWLRRLLATVDDDEYEAVRDRAAEQFNEVDLFSQCMLAFTFPEMADWGTTALEGCLEVYQADQHIYNGAMVLAAMASSAPLGPRLAIAKEHDIGLYKNHNYLFSMLDMIGSDAFPVLKAMYDKRWWSYDSRVAEALAMIESEEVARLFARCLDKWTKDAPEVETEYLKAHPQWARPALEGVTAANQEEGSEPSRAEALLGVLEADQQIVSQEVRQEDKFADRAMLPRGLASPPWHQDPPKKAKKKGKASKVEPLDYTPRFFVSDETRAAYREADVENVDQRNAATDKKLLEQWEATYKDEQYSKHLRIYPEELTSDGNRQLLKYFPPEVVWEQLKDRYYWTIVPALVALSDPEAFDEGDEPDLTGFFAMIRTRDKKQLSPLLEHLDDPGLAAMIAEMATTKTHRSEAVDWLGRFPEAAAIGLIPAILNTTGKKKKATYEAALQLAMEKGDRAIVEEVAERYGDDVLKALTALDPYQIYPKKMPKMPFFWSPSSYSPLRLKEHPERCLPMEVIEDVGLMLKFSGTTPYIGLRELQEVVDPIALDRWAWELFASWVKGECPMDEIWPLSALALFGQGTMLNELPLLLDQWYSTGHHQRGWRLMDIFQELATPWTILALEQLYGSALHPYVSADVYSRLSKINDGVKLRRIVAQAIPTLGWSHERGPVLTPREGEPISVLLDPMGVAVLQDAQGLVMYGLPESIGEDDPCRVVWESLSQQVAWVTSQVYLMLEMAMRHDGRWDRIEWEEDWLGHPLLHPIVTKLIWGFFKEDEETPQTTFLPSVDGDLIDVKGKTFHWPSGDVRLGIVHPMRLGKKQETLLEAWRKRLRQEDIEQPFPQLHRPVYTLTDEEREAKDIKRFNGQTFPMTHTFLLGRTGWTGEKRSWGTIPTIARPFPVSKGRGSPTFDLRFKQGIPASDYLLGTDLEIQSLSAGRYRLDGQPEHWLSDLIYDFVRLCGE